MSSKALCMFLTSWLEAGMERLKATSTVLHPMIPIDAIRNPQLNVTWRGKQLKSSLRISDRGNCFFQKLHVHKMQSRGGVSVLRKLSMLSFIVSLSRSCFRTDDEAKRSQTLQCQHLVSSGLLLQVEAGN